MNVIVENHIPFIQGHLEAAGHRVTYLAPEQITPEAVRNADTLIIRTRTRCDARLLGGSRVSTIATATIGTDHIDLDYCRAHDIAVKNAPGSNAPAVAQYVLASINALNIKQAIIGIVGFGHVGSIVDRWARANGFRTIVSDPPLGIDTPLSALTAEADIITFHTPLDATTHHMADSSFFASCHRRPLIINAARGAIVNTPAMIDALDLGLVSGAIIDCWEGEPSVNAELLRRAVIATPHIAGYSLEGKRRATAMALAGADSSITLPLDPVAKAPTMAAIAASYDPMADSGALKAAPELFESLRNNYSYRHEPR